MGASAGRGRSIVRNGVAVMLLVLVAATRVASAAPGKATNQAPTISGDPPATATAGQPYDFVPVATDPDGDMLNFSIKSRPNWASFDRKSGRVSGTPAPSSVGAVYSVTIAVSDRWSKAELGPFTVTVVSGTSETPPPSNGAPVISGTPPTSVTAGQAYSFTPSASDPDGDALTFSIQNKPAWASFNAGSGQLSGTPSQSSSHSGIIISASDGTASTSLPSFSIEVLAVPNTAPVISGTPPTSVTAGQPYTFTPSASDAEGDGLLFAIRNKPAWASFSSSSGRLSGTPGSSAVGVYSGIEISVSDGKTSTSLPAFSIEVVAAPNTAPVISGTPPTSVTEGQAYSFTPSASDADGDALGFTIRNKPAWATFSTSTGRLSGTPATGSAGVYSGIEIAVSDGKTSTSLPAFSITVLAPSNTAPVISGTPPTSVTVGQSYSFTPTAIDAEKDPLTFSIQNKPAWATFSTSTGKLSGTPTSGYVGSYTNIVIKVSDGKLTSALPAFSITVEQLSTGSATLSWTPPTQNVDGSPLTDLAGFRIAYGTSAGNLNQVITLMNPGITTAVIENLTSGTWYFAVKALSASGAESDYSNTAAKTVP